MDVRVSDLGPPRASAAFYPPDALRRVGLIVLETDLTMERDVARLTHGRDVGVHATRVAFANPITAASLAALEARLTDAAASLIPDAPFDVVHFGCTSASAVIGDAGVAAAVRAAKPGAAVTNPVIAADAALRALGVHRLSILTPYVPEVSRPVAARFADLGYRIEGLTCWGIEDDRDMALVRPDTLVREAAAAIAPQAEALFISCTAVPSAEAVTAIEAEIGRPVVTSNQAAAWMALRLCGVEDDIPEGGRLFGRTLAPQDRTKGAA
ncbi:ectoine utilization protein EutA [Roseospira marina]|uniref:Ectoine utilization protein EutA n=1 Tax=Roseospira marina TaxID=140057 RepID=A0A5M6I7D0_9PROT|nr:ectoine utilization protein EutA [Roseospira marina]KAA5604106.1 ectoine utilization protein EutA [Roseospira marina]MBB4315794.1 maleate isomerase [Roseospira marina]MBB5088967.1 maleate isomerase [Roseospira marina]